jgi:hypothetical protein
MMDKIILTRRADDIHISILSEQGGWSVTRRLSKQSAIAMSCLLFRSPVVTHAITMEVAPGIAIQVEKADPHQAWLTFANAAHGNDLVASIKGERVLEIASYLHDLCLPPHFPACPEVPIYVRDIAYCYLDDGTVEPEEG